MCRCFYVSYDHYPCERSPMCIYCYYRTFIQPRSVHEICLIYKLKRYAKPKEMLIMNTSEWSNDSFFFLIIHLILKVWKYSIPPELDVIADWAVRLDGRWAAGWMEGGVDGGSASSAELCIMGWASWMISLVSVAPKRVEPSFSQLILDELLLDFTIGVTEPWWLFTLGGEDPLDECFVRLFILFFTKKISSEFQIWFTSTVSLVNVS